VLNPRPHPATPLPHTPPQDTPKVAEDAPTKTLGDWLSRYLSESPLADLLPTDAEQEAA